MTLPSLAVVSRPLRELRAALQRQAPLDPQALSALSDAVEHLEERERALIGLLSECYGVIYTGVLFSDDPANHPDANLAERVLAAACGKPPEEFRKPAPVAALPAGQPVRVIQEPAHA
ncbi:hypothetical protein BJP27_24530 (plasmid) [Pseudomonas oryzihabitans]|nr:hypothetical protein BJP27_23880 [Pseudomonas psychrotolerans]APQ14738.1 hypothetical protein BJP27_24530 [Pseudomonas psychrotolerans]